MKDTLLSRKRIAKYDVQRVLGSGAMGVVYKGYDSQIERPVAIKLLHEHLRLGDNGPVLEERFLQEAKAAARCLHPNIVAIFDFGNDDTPYIVMEYVEGIELRIHMQNGTEISLPSATDIVIQTLSALDHAHSKGIVHRDIKPENIIILESGTVKVSDFGVARLDTSDLTGTGYMIGTPNYMSPEALQGMHCDTRADIYSTGILFYELVSKGRYCRDDGLDENLKKLSQSPHLSQKNIHCLQKILLRALAKNRDERYQKADDFIKDLKSIEDMDLSQATLAVFPRPAASSAKTVVQVPSSISQLNGELLNNLEAFLARFLGPIAKAIIKKCTRSSSNIEELISQVVQHIPTQKEREQFIRWVDKSAIHTQSIVPSTSSAKPISSKQAVSITESQKQAVVDILTFYSGPIAKRLVTMLSKQCKSQSQLVELCSKRIPDDQDREAFIKQCKVLV